MVRSTSRWFSNPLLSVTLITLAGTALRFYGLNSRALWLDEAIMYWVSRGTPAAVIAQNAAQQSSPPLFALLTNLLSFLGDYELILRAPSWLAGIAAIPAMYWLAREFLTEPAAYFSTGIAALSVTLIEYSQQAREYALTFLFAVLMIGCFVQFLRQPTRAAAAGVIISSSLGIFLQYGLGLLALALNLVMLVAILTRRDRRALFLPWVFSQVFVLAAVLAVFQLALAQQLAAWPVGPGAGPVSSHLETTYWNGTAGSLLSLAFSNTSRLVYFAYPNLYLVLFITAVGLITATVIAERRIVLLLCACPTAVTFAGALMRKYPYDGVRQDIFLLPMLFVLAGCGFEYLWQIDRRRIAAGTFAVLLGLGAFSPLAGYYRSQPEDIRPIVSSLNTSYASGDRIYVYYGANPAFRYYYRSSLAQTTFGAEHRNDPAQYAHELDPLLGASGSVWLVFSHCYNDECDQIANHAARFRPTTRVADTGDALLYVASGSHKSY